MGWYPKSAALPFQWCRTLQRERLTTGEFLHFLGQSRGSLIELETQLDMAFDLEYLGTDQHHHFENEIYQVLSLLKRLIESLRRSKQLLP